jgi:hypothetical protein
MEGVRDPPTKMMFPIKSQLYIKYFGFAIIFGIHALIKYVKNSTITNLGDQWGMLTKQRVFWKTKSHIATTWAFYLPMTSSSLKSSSNSNSTSLE